VFRLNPAAASNQAGAAVAAAKAAGICGGFVGVALFGAAAGVNEPAAIALWSAVTALAGGMLVVAGIDTMRSRRLSPAVWGIAVLLGGIAGAGWVVVRRLETEPGVVWALVAGVLGIATLALVRATRRIQRSRPFAQPARRTDQHADDNVIDDPPPPPDLAPWRRGLLMLVALSGTVGVATTLAVLTAVFIAPVLAWWGTPWFTELLWREIFAPAAAGLGGLALAGILVVLVACRGLARRPTMIAAQILWLGGLMVTGAGSAAVMAAMSDRVAGGTPTPGAAADVAWITLVGLLVQATGAARLLRLPLHHVARPAVAPRAAVVSLVALGTVVVIIVCAGVAHIAAGVPGIAQPLSVIVGAVAALLATTTISEALRGVRVPAGVWAAVPVALLTAIGVVAAMAAIDHERVWQAIRDGAARDRMDWTAVVSAAAGCMMLMVFVATSRRATTPGAAAAPRAPRARAGITAAAGSSLAIAAAGSLTATFRHPAEFSADFAVVGALITAAAACAVGVVAWTLPALRRAGLRRRWAAVATVGLSGCTVTFLVRFAIVEPAPTLVLFVPAAAVGAGQLIAVALLLPADEDTAATTAAR
jgi:hypothetical protein